MSHHKRTVANFSSNFSTVQLPDRYMEHIQLLLILVLRLLPSFQTNLVHNISRPTMNKLNNISLQEDEKKTIKISLKLKSSVVNQKIVKPLFRIKSIFSSINTTQNICKRKIIKYEATRFRNNGASIIIQIKSFSAICHSGEYLISYWNGYWNKNNPLLGPKIREIKFKIQVKNPNKSFEQVDIFEVLICKNNETELYSTKCNTGICCASNSINMRRCRCPSTHKGAQCGSLVTEHNGKHLRIFGNSRLRC